MAISGEFELIDKIKKWCSETSVPGVEVGIGDDCAVLRSQKGNLVTTVDCLIEGVHFDLSYCPPEDLGHKALAINLSDIASMGATPNYALVSLVLTEKQDEKFVEDLYRGLTALAKAHTVAVVGGNIARSKSEVSIHVTVMGSADSWILRSGAHPGDWVAITGQTGKAAAGFSALRTLGEDARKNFPELTRAWLRPQPRVKEMYALKQSGVVTSAIDLSDGLSSELGHLVQASHCGLLIDQARIPVAKEIVEYSSALTGDEVETTFEWVMNGGEDYEVLLTLNPAKRAELEKCLHQLGLKLFVIGEVKYAADGILLKTREGTLQLIPVRGWQHFK